MRREIYSEVMNNHDYLKELMDSMKTSSHVKMMIKNDTAFFNSITRDTEPGHLLSHLMQKAENDTAVCKQICASMVDHKKVMSKMLETFVDGGVIKKGCMIPASDNNKTEKGR